MTLSHIYQGVGVFWVSGTNSRRDWQSVDSRLTQGDTLVVVVIDGKMVLRSHDKRAGKGASRVSACRLVGETITSRKSYSVQTRLPGPFHRNEVKGYCMSANSYYIC